ncbi:MAG: hypothetical protein K8823_1030 [Cenarchaeum symbiont of Oopsacas minuta]|nr:hypothetical protein [Cenarchaeum symbiont of Oopsacas minuta]
MQICLYLLIFIALSPTIIYAQSEILVDIEMEEYTVGDYLNFTLRVPEIIQENATFTLVHKSYPNMSITLPVPNTTSIYPAIDPIDSFYPSGIWTIQIQYGDMFTKDTFMVVDSDEIYLPMWLKDVFQLWTQDVISDIDYGGFLYVLYEAKIIDKFIPIQIESAQIPDWFKHKSTTWWIQGNISDSEYVASINYLVPEIIRLR